MKFIILLLLISTTYANFPIDFSNKQGQAIKAQDIDDNFKTLALLLNKIIISSF